MKTKYEHLHFEEVITGKSWECRNNKTNNSLGYVAFYPRWKCFVFAGYSGCVFDISCLTDIIDFMNQLKAAEEMEKEK